MLLFQPVLCLQATNLIELFVRFAKVATAGRYTQNEVENAALELLPSSIKAASLSEREKNLHHTLLEIFQPILIPAVEDEGWYLESREI